MHTEKKKSRIKGTGVLGAERGCRWENNKPLLLSRLLKPDFPWAREWDLSHYHDNLELCHGDSRWSFGTLEEEPELGRHCVQCR